MRPSPRVQAAIELLDSIIEASQNNGAPADRLIANYFRERRYAGSKDRRAVRELVYGAIRACGPVPVSGRAAMLRLAEIDETIAPLFDGGEHSPAPIEPGEPVAQGGIAPHWLVSDLDYSGIDEAGREALLERAPLDIRVNTIKADRETIELPVEGEHLAAAQALRFESGTQVEQWDAWKEGKIEVQDLGSQIACMAVGAKPGETIVDLCAGAGGKTLALASAMTGGAVGSGEFRGKLIASDTDRGRLQRLAPRAERSGAMEVESILLNPNKEWEKLSKWEGRADAVLVDAPCSGSGTWRRNPEARWRLNTPMLTRYTDAQDRLINMATQLLKPGGRLIFVTCSMLDIEGPLRIERFCDSHDDWEVTPPELPLGEPRGKGIRLTPSQHGTDGFFIACLTSPA